MAERKFLNELILTNQFARKYLVLRKEEGVNQYNFLKEIKDIEIALRNYQEYNWSP